MRTILGLFFFSRKPFASKDQLVHVLQEMVMGMARFGRYRRLTMEDEMDQEDEDNNII